MNQQQFILAVQEELKQIAPELTVTQEYDAFTIWFTSKYLDCPIPEADDAFVGGSNDFGIDAIYILSSDAEGEVVGYVIQTKYTNDPLTAETVNNLRAKQDWLGKPLPEEMNSRVKNKWAALNQAITTGGEDAQVRFVIATMGDCTEAASAACNEAFSNPHVDTMDIYDFDTLWSLYYPGFEDSLEDQLVLQEWALEANQIMKIAEQAVNAWLAIVPLIKLKNAPEIESKRLFAANVRYEISRTAIKRGIKRTIADNFSRDKFFLRHNGITIVASHVIERRNNTLMLRNFSVVNGCQSIVAIYQCNDEDLRTPTVLVRVYQTNDPELMRDISEFTNTQTSVQQRDLRSNTTAQRALKESFLKSRVNYVVKRGEPPIEAQYSVNGIINNTEIAQIIYAFEEQLPHRAHRKDTLFKPALHETIFGGKTANQIYIIWKLHETIKQVMRDETLRVPEALAGNQIAAWQALASIKSLERWPDKIENWPPIEHVAHDQEWRDWFNTAARMAVNTLKTIYVEATENPQFDRITWLKDAETIHTLTREIRRDEGRIIATTPEFHDRLTPPFPEL